MLIGTEVFILKPGLIQLGGFAILLLGTFTYNELVEWKIWGLNKGLSKYKLGGGSIEKEPHLLTVAKQSSKGTSEIGEQH